MQCILQTKKNMIAIRINILTWVFSPPRISYHLPTYLRSCQTNARCTECDRDVPTPCRRSLPQRFVGGTAFLTTGELQYSSPLPITYACWSKLQGEYHHNLLRKCWIPWTSSRLAGTCRMDGANSHLADGEPIPWQTDIMWNRSRHSNRQIHIWYLCSTHGNKEIITRKRTIGDFSRGPRAGRGKSPGVQHGIHVFVSPTWTNVFHLRNKHKQCMLGYNHQDTVRVQGIRTMCSNFVRVVIPSFDRFTQRFVSIEFRGILYSHLVCNDQVGVAY